MRILYIGQHTNGTTSKMRADVLQKILNPERFEVIDTHIPFYNTTRYWRTIGFRLKIGPLMYKTNDYILQQIEAIGKDLYDIIWVDKGVFLYSSTIRSLKRCSVKLIHFTPDMAFFGNRSRHFEKAMAYYDFLITTKSAEKELYLKHIPAQKLIMTTQGFSNEIHQGRLEFKSRKNAVAFIGLNEAYREKVVQKLIDNKINVELAGKGWETFLNKNRSNKFLQFHGAGLFAKDYSDFLSSSKIGLGLVSKKFPELHTTRTFEIPACGSALLTERNFETSSFFDSHEAIFYDNLDNMLEKAQFFLEHLEYLEEIAMNGAKKVREVGYDYETILNNILKKILI